MGASGKFCLALLVMTSACTTLTDESERLSSLARQTAGPATIASFAELCGTPSEKVDLFMEAYLNSAGTKTAITPDDEERIRKTFANARTEIRDRFPTPEAVTQRCTKYPPNQAVLDRGIAGDFSGTIQ